MQGKGLIGLAPAQNVNTLLHSAVIKVVTIEFHA